MKRILLLPLLLALSLSGCHENTTEFICTGFPLERPTLTDESTYQIINLILESYYDDNQYINIVQQTGTTYGLDIDYIKAALEQDTIEYDSLTLKDYSEKNSSVNYLSGEQLNSSVLLLVPDELGCIFGNNHNGWETYYQKYAESHGYLVFSCPGMNPEGTEAIIEYGWYAGPLAAGGNLIILEKTGGSWKIAHHLLTWVS